MYVHGRHECCFHSSFAISSAPLAFPPARSVSQELLALEMIESGRCACVHVNMCMCDNVLDLMTNRNLKGFGIDCSSAMLRTWAAWQRYSVSPAKRSWPNALSARYCRVACLCTFRSQLCPLASTRFHSGHFRDSLHIHFVSCKLADQTNQSTKMNWEHKNAGKKCARTNRAECVICLCVSVYGAKVERYSKVLLVRKWFGTPLIVYKDVLQYINVGCQLSAFYVDLQRCRSYTALKYDIYTDAKISFRIANVELNGGCLINTLHSSLNFPFCAVCQCCFRCEWYISLARVRVPQRVRKTRCVWRKWDAHQASVSRLQLSNQSLHTDTRAGARARRVPRALRWEGGKSNGKKRWEMHLDRKMIVNLEFGYISIFTYDAAAESIISHNFDWSRSRWMSCAWTEYGCGWVLARARIRTFWFGQR